MIKQIHQNGCEIVSRTEKIISDKVIQSSPKPLKGYRAEAWVLDPLTGKPICGPDLRAVALDPVTGELVCGGDSQVLKRACRMEGKICVQASAATPEEAERNLQQKIPRLIERVRPVLKAHTNANQTLTDVYQIASLGWGLSKTEDRFLRKELLPLVNLPLRDLRPEDLYQIVRDMLERMNPSENRWNVLLGSIEKMVQALIRDGFLKKQDHFPETLARLRKTGKSMAGKKREIRDHLTDQERACLFKWAQTHPEEWLSVLVAMIYLVRDIEEICALNTDDLQWIQVQGYHLAVFWVCKRMTRKDKKYAVDRDIPSPHVRRLPLFEWIQRQLDTRAATLEDPPQSRPLMGGGPHGTVRITPDTAEKELAARLTALGIRVRTHTSEADSDNDLVQLLRSDAAYCAREVMHLRDAEQELLLDLAFTSTDARHYWDPDCDETMFKLWQAGHRLVPHPAGKLQVSVQQHVIPEDGTLKMELPEDDARWQVQVQADQAVTLQADSRYGHKSTGDVT